jgi:hypothetical protein
MLLPKRLLHQLPPPLDVKHIQCYHHPACANIACKYYLRSNVAFIPVLHLYEVYPLTVFTPKRAELGYALLKRE